MVREAASRAGSRFRRAVSEFRLCAFMGPKIGLAITSAIVSACALRGILAIAAVLLPQETWASDMAGRAMSLATIDFGMACAIAAVGGAASLFHELRTDLTRFSLVNGVGHMTLAQFAGLLTYLLAVQYGWQVPIALVGCGISGWGGNRSIVAINNAVLRRLGIAGSDQVQR